MSLLTEALREHNLSTAKEIIRNTTSSRHNYGSWNQTPAPDPAWVAKCDILKKAYGSKVSCEQRYESAYIKCNDNCWHSIYGNGDGFAYSWPGQNYLVANTPVPIDVLHKVNKLKEKELEAARKKRFETIKSPRDAVRLIFRDLKIKEVTMVGGHPRLNCGPFEIEFKASNESSDPHVKVSFVYRTHYVHEILLTTLNIADPDFSKRVEAIVSNGQNLSKLMLGEVQPKAVASV